MSFRPVLFGRDEFIALWINVTGTAVVSGFATNPFILSLAGPIIEKLGFFVAYLREAWIIYTTTLRDKRGNILSYILEAFKRDRFRRVFHADFTRNRRGIRRKCFLEWLVDQNRLRVQLQIGVL